MTSALNINKISKLTCNCACMHGMNAEIFQNGMCEMVSGVVTLLLVPHTSTCVRYGQLALIIIYS